MATHDIPRGEWKAFLEEFTRRHEGARVTMEAVDPRSSPQAEATGLPLVEIAYEEGGGGDDASAAGRVFIVLGDEAGRHVTHAIDAPRHVYHKPGAGVLSSEVNPDEILEITAGGEPPITYLHFRHGSTE